MAEARGESRFEVGATVQLKSGGPVMTVASYNESIDQYICTWFLSDKQGSKLERGSFPPATLEKFEGYGSG